MQQNKKGREKLWIPILLIILYTYVMYELSLGMFRNEIGSDFLPHLEDPGERGINYSLCHFVMAFFYGFGREEGAAVSTTLFMTGTIGSVYMLMKRIMPQLRRDWGLTLSVMLCTVIAVYTPFLQMLPFALAALALYLLLRRWIPQGARKPVCALLALGAALCCCYTPVLEKLYMGTASPNVFHNPTYLMMKPLALASLAVFLDFYQTVYTDRPDLKRYALYTLLLTLSTAMKPSYVFAFAPALLCVLICDFIRQKCRMTLRQVLMGVSVFPSLGLCLFQAGTLFGVENAGSMEFSILALWRQMHYEQWGLICIDLVRSFILPVCMIAFVLLRRRKGSFDQRFALLIFAVSVFEGFFVSETGFRFEHGNLLWTAYIGLAVLMAVYTAAGLDAIGFRSPEDLQGVMDGSSASVRWQIGICSVVFNAALFSGLYYLLYYGLLFHRLLN